MQRKLAAIIHADVVGYSRLMEGNETVTLRRLKSLRKQLWDPAIAQHNGRLVGTAGDALLIEFASAVSAVRCAVDLQKGMDEYNAEEPDHRKMKLRIGINLGEVIVDEDDDIFGDGVNLAARLQAMAEPGGVLVSAKVHDEVVGRVANEFIDGGEHQVKNIARPVRVYSIVLDGQVDTQSGERPSPQIVAAPLAEALPPERATRPGAAPPTPAPITRMRTTIRRRPENSWSFVGKDREGVAFEVAVGSGELGKAEDGLVIGRHSGQCDVVIAHGSLSRRHARLRLEGDRLTIEDLGSTNGVIVDGMRLPVETPRPLRDGAQLLLGEIKFLVSENGGIDEF